MLKEVVDIISENKKLPAKYKERQLTGNYSDFRECHIKNDWILIYRIGEVLELYLFRTGTHSDLFD